jgi:Domain of unknown function (DUF1707)
MAPDRRIRASDQDRESTAELLSEAYAVGRLSREEFDERVTAAYSAKTCGNCAILPPTFPSGGANRPPLRHRGFAARAAENQPRPAPTDDMDLCAPVRGWPVRDGSPRSGMGDHEHHALRGADGGGDRHQAVRYPRGNAPGRGRA